MIEADMAASPRRFEARGGLLPGMLANGLVLCLYGLGVDPHTLFSLYYRRKCE